MTSRLHPCHERDGIIACSGYRNVPDYIVNLLERDATRILAEHENFTLQDDIFDRFIVACENKSKTNIHRP